MVALGVLPKWFNPVWITVAQISQMFVGVFVTASATYYKYMDGGCVGAKDPLLLGAMVMYGSYFYLFVQFAVLRFVIAPKRKNSKQLKHQPEKEKSTRQSKVKWGASVEVPLESASLSKQEDSYGSHLESKNGHPEVNATVRSDSDDKEVDGQIEGKEKAQ